MQAAVAQSEAELRAVEQAAAGRDASALDAYSSAARVLSTLQRQIEAADRRIAEHAAASDPAQAGKPGMLLAALNPSPLNL